MKSEYRGLPDEGSGKIPPGREHRDPAEESHLFKKIRPESCLKDQVPFFG
ncbi:hypothetical protein B4098_1514 [Heyndrickxia coagulans]|uniref:Uncharacterized protein n=1 Tax=Heyndrickxia coagulans TaxID=1398 RepID=A0A150JNJ4_HEYCO|nr:hypothetical protein B4098_1514 [Heyndrickxia coagulans]